MRIRLTLDDDQLATAREYTGITEVSTLMREALTRLIQSEASRSLARMGGTQPNLGPVYRKVIGASPEFEDIEPL